jgi:lipopolysaccharide/colanic/teichoic acid biosynthesis glycosyltransferase
MMDAEAEIQELRIPKKIRPALKQRYHARSRLLSYKTSLLLHDIILLLGIATFVCHPTYAGRQLAFNYLIAFTVLFFCFNLRLYSYHLIFSLRLHLTAIGKAFLSALLTVAIVAAIIAIPADVINIYLIPVTLMLVAVIVLLNRTHDVDLLGLLYPVGFSFLVIGASEIWWAHFPAGNALAWQPVLYMLLWSLLLLTLSRTVVVHFLFNVLLRRRFRRQVIVVGHNQGANEFTRHILDLNAPFWIAGTIECRRNAGYPINGATQKACLGKLEDLPELTLQHHISDIVVTSDTISKQDLIEILDFCTSACVNAWFSPSLMPIIDIKLHIDRFCDKPMVRLCSQKRSWLFYKLKYMSDALITLPLFILQLPLFLFIMAGIKLESKGPVFYVARAIGKGGKPFDMLKFRSMCADSDKSIHQKYVTKLIKGEIHADEQKNGPIKIVHDPRVTKVGRILRKLSLDELPQLINVLKGQMSLVGPRPCLPYEYDIYQDWHKKRTAVRPGITGLWQVTGRSEVLFMILLDLYYIYNSSVLLEKNGICGALIELRFVLVARH